MDWERPTQQGIYATSELIPTRNMLQIYTFFKLQKEPEDQTSIQNNHYSSRRVYSITFPDA